MIPATETAARRKPRRNVISDAKSMTGYRWKPEDLEKSAILHAVLWLIDRSGRSDEKMSELSEVSLRTIRAWRFGVTMRPRDESVEKIVKALNIRRGFIDQNGNVLHIPGWSNNPNAF